MSAKIIPLFPDMYKPLSFDMPPENAVDIHRQWLQATRVLEVVQQLRNTIEQTGEPLPPNKQLLLTYLAEDCAGYDNSP